MDRLAPEIICNIISRLYDEGEPLSPDNRIAPLAVLCRQWQPLVEAQTFRRLRLDETFRFPIIGSPLTPLRLSYIRKLVYIFPPGNFDMSIPTPFDKRPKTDFTSMILQILFYQLAKIPLIQEPLLNLELVTPVFGDFLRGCPRDLDVGFTLPDLPELPMAMFYIASKMPRLREFSGVLTTTTSSIYQRIELAESLSMLPTSIHNFGLKYHQRHLPDGLLTMQDGEDILTRELRRFSQREGLKDFAFHGCVEPSIFWPPASDASDPRHWPTLKSFLLGMYDVQGLTCLRANEPLSNAEDKEHWDRVYAHGGLMNEFYQAAAKCSACMPKAEYNSIDFNDDWGTSLAFCTVDPDDPCLTLIGKTDIEIEDETVREWRKAAEARNLVFKVRLGNDDDEQYQAIDAFKPGEVVEKEKMREDEVEESDGDESSDGGPEQEAIRQRILEQTEARAIVAANFYPFLPFNPLGG
ncbi:unnamed protein product [Fusarium venenatum]|uniref:Uncharacterized protein n=1 Tax=Fusarium venenatum TaxID=56646 RepID=A0A2L2TH99_9HYPO|nr:uncharacterized protein FVRRES_13623 [Fusarium venenatum]CEI41534.1 unnamed protein product [Fusarium venenatum]